MKLLIELRQLNIKCGFIWARSACELPADVRHLVKSNYYDFDIFLVIELTVNNQTTHLVKIEDKTHFKTIRVMDGEMDVMEDIEKL